MIEAGQEEKRLAEERNDYHQGVPAITVIVGGGWSKCSHKHSYNAKSGVGVTISHATGKILYVGVRNKYCSACSQGIPQAMVNNPLMANLDMAQDSTNAIKIGIASLQKWNQT